MPAQREPVSDLHHTTCDVAVVGGGVIGLAVAWRARARGLSVVVLERDAVPPTGGSSYVAAGMLAPVAEAEFGERALLALGLESARRWPSFAAELTDVTGVDPGYRPAGTLVVARDGAEAAWLDREAAFRERVGLRAERLRPAQARTLEPALAPALRAAMEVPDDHTADPRALLRVLHAAATAAGVVVRERTPVTSLVVEDGRATGVRLEDGGEVRASTGVLLAAGAWTTVLDGVPPAARLPVRPLKGQIMRLSDPAGPDSPGLVERTIRYETGYLVPRGGGRYVLGATMEEQGFDTAVTAGGAYELIRDAAELVPGVLELRIDDFLAGLRPTTPDNAPVLGAHPACPGLHYATGHHRNGILLAPVTADLVAAELAGEPADHPFGPARFAAEVVS
jgi:glycine oxidase